ncbi:MAG: sensor domain-containing diguanylate cyclase [Lachnospiraceae bacterium]|nr:sensor domain-containing diguanylate cyclase [Lachnospiraceae bacterium]
MIDTKKNIQLLNEVFEGVYCVDTKRTITYWNESAEKITGFMAEEVVGNHCYANILKHVDQNGHELCLDGCPLHATIQDGIIREADVYLHHKKGHRVSVSIKAIPLTEAGKIIGAVEFMVQNCLSNDPDGEIEKYRNLAMKDALTEVPNRRYIETYLELKMKEYKNFDFPFGVAFIDIDFFKKVNDTYGHEAGDEILKMIARTFENATRGNDLIGRWGGEEFLTVFTNCRKPILGKLSEKIRMLVEKSVLEFNTVEISVTISIGATMIRPDDTVDSIVKRADELMYKSKMNGRNKCTID